MGLTGKALRSYLAYAVHGRKAPAPARTAEPAAIRKQPAKAKRATPRRGPARDAKYRRWIRSLPCVACGTERQVEAAHTDVLTEQNARGGMSMKHSDYSCVPLCHDCHQGRADSYHRIDGGRAAFERRYALDCAALVARLNAGWRDLTEAA